MNNIEDINNILKFKNYYNGELYNNPQPLEGQIEPYCIFYKKYNNIEHEFSIVMPIHNQENIISKQLDSIIEYTGSTYEIILIIDSCEDNTEKKILEWENNMKKNNSVSNIIIIKSETPLFEAAADNIGFRLSTGKYILEIQADMEMCEKNYNLILKKPFEKIENVIAVSGRCSHDFKQTSVIGRGGRNILYPYNKSLYNNNTFYIYETCNRGPLLLSKEKIRKLGFLDEKNFYLDDSDHDLMARAYYNYGYICGYVPIDFNAPLENGSTRKPRSNIQQYFLYLRKNMSDGGFLRKYIDNLYIKRNLLQFDLINNMYI
jgi:glycosyltransferase involved in cell wall biosynthesis